MKVNNDFELKYTSTLKECFALFEEESRHEREQVSLALRIGEKVNEIANDVEDKESVFKRLARDLSKGRRKFIAPSKISEYRQLYLNFESMDTVTAMESFIMNDVTVRLLAEIASKDMNPPKKSKVDEPPLLTMLKRAGRLLDRVEVAVENDQPDDRVMQMIVRELELIRAKDEAILHTLRISGNRPQLDLFRRHTFLVAEV